VNTTMNTYIVSFYYNTDNRTEYKIETINSAIAVLLACERLRQEQDIAEWCEPSGFASQAKTPEPFHIRVRLDNGY
jgi:hypothetical protein